MKRSPSEDSNDKHKDVKDKKESKKHNWSEIISLLASVPEPAVLIGLDYRILAVNKAYEETYATSEESAQQKYCYEISHRYTRPCDEAGENCPLKESREKKKAHRVLHLHHTPRGEEHVDVEMHPILGEDGEILYFLERMRTSKVASSHPEGGGLIGRSSEFNQMLEFIERVAPTDSNVLLLGESGTGKEVVASAIHQASQRTHGPFVPVECSGLSESLFESELFGHEKGSFTGAINRKPGLVEAAHGGTLFLDEIGDVPMPMQVKLLRLLESQTYRRVGGNEPLKAEFRLIAATHQDLPKMVEDGRFRQDLFYRICVFPINLPALRERTTDIKILSQHLLKKIAPKKRWRISKTAISVLEKYEFPGNIRELRNILERACILSDTETIEESHLLLSSQNHLVQQDMSKNVFEEIIPLDEVELQYLRWVSGSFQGENKDLASRLGVSERTLYRKLKSAAETKN